MLKLPRKHGILHEGRGHQERAFRRSPEKGKVGDLGHQVALVPSRASRARPSGTQRQPPLRGDTGTPALAQLASGCSAFVDTVTRPPGCSLSLEGSSQPDGSLSLSRVLTAGLVPLTES